mmetsp:Transcript_20218/g.51025  ORF Transcript_20218/g.51025 Transcript_20218/m.51025 type:complete len:218 (-) Transcript_20218:1419-2072(-)
MSVVASCVFTYRDRFSFRSYKSISKLPVQKALLVFLLHFSLRPRRGGTLLPAPSPAAPLVSATAFSPQPRTCALTAPGLQTPPSNPDRARRPPPFRMPSRTRRSDWTTTRRRRWHSRCCCASSLSPLADSPAPASALSSSAPVPSRPPHPLRRRDPRSRSRASSKLSRRAAFRSSSPSDPKRPRKSSQKWFCRSTAAPSSGSCHRPQSDHPPCPRPA